MDNMDMYGFYTGKIFNAYEFLGAHTSQNGTVFRAFAPNAESLAIIGEFSDWNEIQMQRIHDGNFYECYVPDAKEGMMYKIRVHERGGRVIDHSDPYGYSTELRPHNASIICNMSDYQFQDEGWMQSRSDGKRRPVNIYEVHLGSWKTNSEDENGWYRYEELAEQLVEYVKENGYNYIEIMPICEYPCDESWGYQAIGFYSPTSRYGTPNGLKKMIDICHQNGIGVILDFAPVHFAVNDYGLANFDGTALYEYPHEQIGYNEWGSKNFIHSRGEVKSFLQSAACYWIKEYHFDGIRMDAISNMIYWQGESARGVNNGAVTFIQYMNENLKRMFPDIMLIAEDSTSYQKVTEQVSSGGLGFDYKWNMGWMNDTLEYFREDSNDRKRDYYKLAFSMQYFYSDRFLLPLSHDEVVHGKATILQKMNGQYEEKFPQARALYMYMYAHPGKKLNFMGNEIGQFREWDEKREQDWILLQYPKHDVFHRFMKELNHIYLEHSAFFEKDYDNDGFWWQDCSNQEHCIYAFVRNSATEKIIALFNFSDTPCKEYKIEIPYINCAELLLDSEWQRFDGNVKERKELIESVDSTFMFRLEGFNAKYYILR